MQGVMAASKGGAVRVLIAGDARGRFEELNRKVKQVVAKSGSFDLLLCVGSFLSPPPLLATQEDDGGATQTPTGKHCGESRAIKTKSERKRERENACVRARLGRGETKSKL